MRRAVVSAALLAALGLAGWTGRTLLRPAARQVAAPILRVPRVAVRITVDGETDKPPWMELVGQTPPFTTASGREAVPYSELRIAWGDRYLYLLLYAADPDIRAVVKQHDGPVGRDDSFQLELVGDQRVYQLDVSPLGTIADRSCPKPRSEGRAIDCDDRWESGAVVATDVDGTINDSGGGDEEWVVELAIPLRSISLAGKPGERILLSASRCDENIRRERECGSWGISPRTLELTDAKAPGKPSIGAKRAATPDGGS